MSIHYMVYIRKKKNCEKVDLRKRRDNVHHGGKKREKKTRKDERLHNEERRGVC